MNDNKEGGHSCPPSQCDEKEPREAPHLSPSIGNSGQ